MFTALIRRLEVTLSADESQPAAREDALRIATAALLIEIARADFGVSDEEEATVETLLRQQFGLDRDETRALIEAAESASDESASLFRFTHTLHQHLSQDDKLRIVDMLWRVALADERLDKYEDGLMHKIADLLYVPLGALMAVKHSVQQDLGIE